MNIIDILIIKIYYLRFLNNIIY